MDAALRKYLARHAALDARPLEWVAPPPAAPELALVIPVLAEYPGLLDTLRDLAQNPAEWRAKTLLIVVVNNRNPAHTSPEDIENNRHCLEMLRAWGSGETAGLDLPLALVDAASPGCELAAKEGVGHARKMGLDWGAKLLGERGLFDAPLICLDADTRVPENYLPAIGAYFAQRPRWGVVIDYDHPKPENAEVTPAILAYELYLRYCELGMLCATSPYAYHAIGSAMACSVRAYAAAGGMKRRAAAEDFYFLQALAKTGPIERLWDTRVFPSARTSHRAPIGTGKHVAEFLSQQKDGHKVYHPDCYRTLRPWLAAATECIAENRPTNDPAKLTPAPALRAFLNTANAAGAWRNIMQTAPTPQLRLQQFHVWFDALRTLRAIHHLRDNGLPSMDTLTAIRSLIAMIQEDMPRNAGSAIVEINEILAGLPENGWRTAWPEQAQLVAAMRALTKEMAYTAGANSRGTSA